MSGNAGLPTLATSLNSLEINEVLPHSENTVATVQAFHKVDSESLSHLKSFLLREIAKDIPRRDWPDIDNIARLDRNLRDFLYKDVRDAKIFGIIESCAEQDVIPTLWRNLGLIAYIVLRRHKLDSNVFYYSTSWATHFEFCRR